jgi:hypothetical protein
MTQTQQPTLIFNIIGRMQSLIARMKMSAETAAVPRLERTAQNLIEAEVTFSNALAKMRESLNSATRMLSDIDDERHQEITVEDENSRQLAALLSDLQKESRTVVPAFLKVGGTVVESSSSGN